MPAGVGGTNSGAFLSMDWIAIDIGGANLKAADGLGFAVSRPFPMWRTPERLREELRTILASSPKHDGIAVTMTGELADCFEHRTAGVNFILDAVQQAADGPDLRVLLVDGSLVSVADALSTPLLAAASNWIGLATYCGRYAARGAGLLIDLGSTTCDVIPLRDGRPAPSGRDDLQRSLAGELLYTGVVRSPICGVVRRVPYRGHTCPVSQELFATTYDAYLMLGDLPEDPDDCQTADQRPATRQAARARLGRMIGAEGEAFGEQDALAVAHAVRARQLAMLRRTVRQVRCSLMSNSESLNIETVVVSGQGEFLIDRLFADDAAVQCVSLRKQLGDGPSRCAPAHALAVLAREASLS